MEASVRSHGPIAEHFTQQLTLILVSLATISDGISSKVCAALCRVLQEYSKHLANLANLNEGECQPGVTSASLMNEYLLPQGVWPVRCSPAWLG